MLVLNWQWWSRARLQPEKCRDGEERPPHTNEEEDDTHRQAWMRFLDAGFAETE
jgi:hypothetical protein